MPDGGYALPDIISPNSKIYVCVPIPDDANHRRAFAGALYTLTEWYSWGRDDQQTGALVSDVWFDIWQDVMAQMDQRLDSCGPGDDCTPEVIERIIEAVAALGGVFRDDLDECEDDMPNIIHLNGQAYIVESCGCGESNLYPINPAKVVVGPGGETTVTKKTGVDASGGYDGTDIWGGVTPFNTGQDYLDCYTSKAVPYMLSRAVEYHGLLIDIASTGLDILSGFDEVLDVAAIALGWLADRPEFADWQNYTKEAIEGAFEDDAVVTAGRATLGRRDGPMSRVDLHNWAVSLPQFVGAVPVRWLANDWAQYCRLNEINRSLAEFAISCMDDFSLPSDGANLWDSGLDWGLNNYDYGGQTYPVYIWENPATLISENDAWALDPLPAWEIKALGAIVTQGPDGWGKLKVKRGTPAGDWHGGQPMQTGTDYLCSTESGGYKTLLEYFTGATFNEYYAYTGEATAGVQLYQSGGSNLTVVTHLIAIGAPI